MAPAKQWKAQFISHKLNFLKDQGDRLISAVRLYVHRITAAGESWTHGGDNNLEHQELSQMIDTAIEFLCDKCEELTDGSVGVAANQLSCEQPGQTSQSIATASSTPATSDRQPVAPIPSTATTSYNQSTESVQPADETHMKPVLDRIAVIEEAMCCFRSRTENVAEQHNGIDIQLKELLSKLSKLDKGVDQQLKGLLSKLSESDKKYSSRFKQAKQQINDISETQDAIEQEQKTRLQSLEKQLQKISTAQDRQKAEMESQAELIEKLVHVPKLLESVKENVDTLDARIEEIIDDCSNKHEDIETVTRDLADTVMANTQSAHLISEGQAQNTTLLRELETRFQTLEADGGRNVKDVQKQVEKGETNFRILCQMLNDRLRPLEQLRTCLNERASMRDDNVTKLSQLIQEVAVMSPRLQQLEVKSSGTRCGFTAWTWLTNENADNNIIRQYETMNCNVGQHFNESTGIFTAPVDGLYVASVSLLLSENEYVRVSVQYQQSLDQGIDDEVCLSSTVQKGTTTCDVGVVDMKAGDMLFLRVDQIEKDYYKTVTFSCFLLG